MSKKKEEPFCKLCGLPGKTKCTEIANCLNVSMAAEQKMKEFKRKNRNNILTLTKISLRRAYNNAVKAKKTYFKHKGSVYHTEFAKYLLEFDKETNGKERNGIEKTGHTDRHIRED